MARLSDISRTITNGFGDEHILRPLVEKAIQKYENPKTSYGDDSMDALYQRAIGGIWLKPLFTIIGESTRREVSQAELANKLKLIYDIHKTKQFSHGQWYVFLAFCRYLSHVGRKKHNKETYISWVYLKNLNKVIREIQS